MIRRYVLVDVFADRPLSGNPLAVFPQAEGLSDAHLQSIAREMDHPATAFLFPSAAPRSTFRLRIFSREREIPFAGHPALGAHFVHATENKTPLSEPWTRVAHEGEKKALFEVEMRVERGQITLLRLNQKLPEMGTRFSTEEVARVAASLGLEEEEVAAANQPVRVVSTGLASLIVPVTTLDALGSARPRWAELREIAEGQGATIVYAFTKETRDVRAAAHARGFDVVGGMELPGAGAAAGALSAYLVGQGAVTVLPVTSLVFEQGHLIGRPSTLFAEVHVRDSRIAQVTVGGRVIRVGEGTLETESAPAR